MMPQITVMPAIRSKVGDSWRIKTLDDDNIISVSDRQHGHQRQTSNPYYINFKRRTRNVVNMKPLQHYTDAPLYRAFWPFIMAMKIFGLFHNKEYIKNRQHITICKSVAKNEYSDKTNDDIPPLSKRITPSSIYCFLVTLLLWVNVGRYCTIFKDGEEIGAVLFQKLIMLGFFILVSCNGVTCFLACHKYSNIPEFFYEWARLHQEYPGMLCFGKNKVSMFFSEPFREFTEISPK